MAPGVRWEGVRCPAGRWCDHLPVTGARPPAQGERGGRPAATSAHELAAVAQRLFVERGFDRTTIEEVAAAAGISRRTFFRYFSTKADVLFVESPREVQQLRDRLAGAPADEPYPLALQRAVVEALAFPPHEHEYVRQRAQLVLAEPALQAHATTIFAEWRSVASGFVAARLGCGADDLVPVAMGHAVLATTMAAHEHWVAHPGTRLADALEAAAAVLLTPGR